MLWLESHQARENNSYRLRDCNKKGILLAVSEFCISLHDPLIDRMIDCSNMQDFPFIHATFRNKANEYSSGFPLSDSWFDMSVLSTSAIGKTANADLAMLQSVDTRADDLVIIVGDGRTQPTEIKDARILDAIKRFKFYPDGTDCVVPNIARSILHTIIRAQNYLDKDEWKYVIDDFGRDRGSVLNIWNQLNKALEMVYSEFKFYDVLDDVSQLPAMTGAIARIFGFSRKNSSNTLNRYFRKMELAAVGDTPIFKVIGSSIFPMHFVDQNAKYDFDTLSLIQYLMSSYKISDVEARNLLIERGYFSDSFVEKDNSDVLVCNGSSRFSNRLDAVDPIEMSIRDHDAIVIATDGMFFDCTAHGVVDQKMVHERLLQLLMRDDFTQLMQEIQQSQRSTYEQVSKPRERLSDDMTAVVIFFKPKEIVRKKLTQHSKAHSTFMSSLERNPPQF